MRAGLRDFLRRHNPRATGTFKLTGATGQVIITPDGVVVADASGNAILSLLDFGGPAVAAPSGAINMGNCRLTDLLDPTSAQDAATRAYVLSVRDALVNAAPGALDTIDELAAAFGDDANFATTVTNALALKAALASPTFTGTVTLNGTTGKWVVTEDGASLYADETDANAILAILDFLGAPALLFGAGGASAGDAGFSRTAANVLKMFAGDKWQQPEAPTVGDDLTNKTYVDGRTPAASLTASGLVELATSVETQAGADTARAITPAGLLEAQGPRYGTYYFTDWIGNLSTTGGAGGPFVEFVSGTGAGIGAGTAFDTTHPGLLLLQTGTTTTGRADCGTPAGQLTFSGGAWFFECMVRIEDLSTLAERYAALYGFRDTPTALNQVDGAYFLYDEGGVATDSPGASANWLCVTVSNSVRTFTTTAVAVAADTWVRLTVAVNADGTSVVFSIDGTVVATHTTNIPTGATRATGMGHGMHKSLGTTDRLSYVDYTMFQQVLTASRW